MIARFSILLPFDLVIREGDQLPAIVVNIRAYTARFYAPTCYVDRPKPTDSMFSPLFALATAKPAPFAESLLVEGKRTAQVNVMVLDFLGTEFERSRDKTPITTDPPISVAIDVANWILSRVRVYSRAFQIKPLELGHVPWHLQYLTDAYQQLDRDEAKIRGLQGGSGAVGAATLTPEIVEMVATLQTTEPYAWDQLLLDARAQLPDVGGAVVMASAALETFIDWAMEILHQEHPFPTGLWDWINDRDHWTKEASVSEKFDALLRVFTGQSLENETRLWQAFSELRKARNTLVHEGTAKLGGKPMQAKDAVVLVNNADSIVKWVELLLPEAVRRNRTDATGPFSRSLVSQAEADLLYSTPAREAKSDEQQGRGE